MFFQVIGSQIVKLHKHDISGSETVRDLSLSIQMLQVKFKKNSDFPVGKKSCEVIRSQTEETS